MEGSGRFGLVYPASARELDVLRWAGFWGALPAVPPNWLPGVPEAVEKALRSGDLRRAELVHGVGIVLGWRGWRKLKRRERRWTPWQLSRRAAVLWAGWRLWEQGVPVVALERMRAVLRDGRTLTAYPGRGDLVVGWEGLSGVSFALPMDTVDAVAEQSVTNRQWVAVAPLLLRHERRMRAYSTRLLLHGALALAVDVPVRRIREERGPAYLRALYRFVRDVPEGVWLAVAKKIRRPELGRLRHGVSEAV